MSISRLIDAIIQNDLTAACTLLETAGLDVNGYEDDARLTPLHYAALYYTTDIATLLIAKGANVNAETSEGVTPLDIAEDHNHTSMIHLLKQNSQILQES